MVKKSDLERVSDYVWEISKDYRSDMRVPGRIFASEKILDDILKDESLEQVINVATLPGIQKYSLAMPDIHEGYGAAIGAVFAMDKKDGIISPGAVGYDINCGVRVMRTGVTYDDIKNYIPKLTAQFNRDVPSGVGRGGQIRLQRRDLNKVLEQGAAWAVENGYGTKEDLEHCESNGTLPEADEGAVSDRAKKRGSDQLGTMGAGNHFVEIQRVDTIFDSEAAQKLGLADGEITIMIHCGSRGLGHQVATDYIQTMLRSLDKYGIELPDKQLACAPFVSPEGQQYFGAMASAANFAWASRQLITHEVRRSWEHIFSKSQIAGHQSLELIYDVAHNIAKIEKHDVGGREAEVVVHRKGATRSFPDQPVLIPGSMGTASYILIGQEESMKQSFGSSCHGAGRTMSRTQAKRRVRGENLKRELERKGISIVSGSMAGLAEEAPIAYKDVNDVVRVVENVGLARRVARLRPVGVVKG